MKGDVRIAELEVAARRFGEAWANGDAETLDALLSPSYTHTDVFGDFLKRTAWLDYARGRAGRASHISFRDVETRTFGDVAVINGINEVRGGGPCRRTTEVTLCCASRRSGSGGTGTGCARLFRRRRSFQGEGRSRRISRNWRRPTPPAPGRGHPPARPRCAPGRARIAAT